MPKKNQIKFTDFQKAVRKYLEQNYPKHDVIQGKGSSIRYEVFLNDSVSVPKMWTVHKDKYVHKGDLDKTCKELGITWIDLLSIIKKKHHH